MIEVSAFTGQAADTLNLGTFASAVGLGLIVLASFIAAIAGALRRRG